MENEEEVVKKFIGFVKKFYVDVVFCGFVMYYFNFGEMVVCLVCKFNVVGIFVIVVMVEENLVVSYYY